MTSRQEGGLSGPLTPREAAHLRRDEEGAGRTDGFGYGPGFAPDVPTPHGGNTEGKGTPERRTRAVPPGIDPQDHKLIDALLNDDPVATIAALAESAKKKGD